MKIVRKVLDFITLLVAISFALMVVVILYDATMRYLFQSGSVALQELEWHLFDVVILLSIGYTLKSAAHVRVDIFYDRFSKKTKHIINIVALVFFILPFSLFIIYMAYDFVMMSFVQHEASSDPGGLGFRWIVKALLPLGFVLLILESILALFEEFRELKRC